MELERLLEWLWEILRREGVGDDLEMVEYVCEVLLALTGAQQGLSFQHAPKLRPISTPAREEMEMNLRRACAELDRMPGYNQINRPVEGVLFDRFILPHIRDQRDGGQQVTPREVVDVMLRVLDPHPGETVADLTCGTGGLLVPLTSQEMVGADLSGQWLWLASVNLALNRVRATLVQADAATMTPPPCDILVMDLPRTRSGRRLETEESIMANALRGLAEAGRAAMLVSSRLLQGKRSSRWQLPRVLVGEVAAVATLPRSASRGTDESASHLLLLDRVPLSSFSRNHVWFFHFQSGERGGFILSAPDGSPENLLSAVLYPRRYPWDRRTVDHGSISIDGEGQNYVFVPSADLRVAGVEALRISDRAPVILRLEHVDGRNTVWVGITEALGVVTDSTRERTAAQLTMGRRSAAKNERVLSSTAPGSPILMSASGHLLGVAVPRTRVQTDVPDLRPQTYLGAEAAAESVDSPLELLARIQKNNTDITERILRLVLSLESPVSDRATVPRLAAGEREPHPVGTLSHSQRAVWNLVRERVTTVGDQKTPEYFTVDMVMPTGQEVRHVEQSLDLFRRMGLVAHVLVKGQPYYRRITEQDYEDSSRLIAEVKR